jgi:hypothetical protein
MDAPQGCSIDPALVIVRTNGWTRRRCSDCFPEAIHGSNGRYSVVWQIIDDRVPVRMKSRPHPSSPRFRYMLLSTYSVLIIAARGWIGPLGETATRRDARLTNHDSAIISRSARPPLASRTNLVSVRLMPLSSGLCYPPAALHSDGLAFASVVMARTALEIDQETTRYHAHALCQDHVASFPFIMESLLTGG